MAAHLANLEARDLVSRSRDPRDGRKVVVTISSPGRSALRAREGVVVDSLTRALQELTRSERKALSDAAPLLALLADRL